MREPLGILIAGIVASTLMLAIACSQTEERAGAADGAPDAPHVSKTKLAILVTGDVGGEFEPGGCRSEPMGGVAKRAAVVERERTTSPEHLLVLDAGDHFFRSTTISPRYLEQDRKNALFLATTMRMMNVQAMAVGERDLALGPSWLRTLEAASGAKLLSANLRYLEVQSESAQPFPSFTIIERAGQKVGIVGWSWAPPSGSREEAFLRSIGLRAQAEPSLLLLALRAARAAGAERVIALLHEERARARALIAAIPKGAIDLAFVAHERTPLPVKAAGADMLIMELGTRGQHVHLARFEDGKLQRSELIALTADAAEAPAMMRALEIHRKSASNDTRRIPLEYVGSIACKACHLDAYRHWRKTSHAKAVDTLVGVRQADNLDCRPCHTTGFEHPGGPTASSTVTAFQNVGCESCHGPGRAHTQDPESELRHSDHVPAAVCGECHRDQAEQRPFVYEERLRAIMGPGHGRAPGRSGAVP